MDRNPIHLTTYKIHNPQRQCDMSGVLDVTQNAHLTVRGHMAPVQTTQWQPVPTATMREHTMSLAAVAFFKDSRRVVTGSWDRTLRIWDVENEALVGEPFVGHEGWVWSVAVSPDDRRIASGGVDNTIIVWDVESRQKVFNPLVNHTHWVTSVCFSPDGKRLASGSGDYMVIVWDAKTGVILSTLEGHRNSVQSVTFSPDGLKLASGSADHTIRVWRTDDGSLILDINAHQDLVRSVVWLPDGQQLISASWDTTVKFWNSCNGDQIGQPCTRHTQLIDSLAISSDGSFIATASPDKTVRLWSTKSHQQIGQALSHTDRVVCVAISPNGKLLVSGDDESKVLLWSIQNTLLAGMRQHSSSDSFFVNRSKVKLGRNLYLEALDDAEKVIKLDPSSYIGYELKHAALQGAQRYDEAIEAFNVMLSKLDNTFDPQIQQLRQQYVGPSEAEDFIRSAIHAQLEDAPLRLLNTTTGRLCNRRAQINAFEHSTEYKELLYSSMTHAPLQTEPIKEAVAKYFSWVMLSHRWENKEPLLQDIQDRVVYNLDQVKLQKFCEVAHDAGYRWAWSDTCCINQNDNAEVEQSINSMFVWYRNAALTIVYLSDVPPSSTSGALAGSAWNTRGWTFQEFLASRVILFYQANWTLYLNDRSPNHKESVTIIQELERSSGIDAQSLVNFHPGMTGTREKLQWASSRVTTLQEDIAYSLFGIFGVHLPVIYGETKQIALGRLLQEIVAQSGDITALDWVGKSSEFNTCLPADIASYKLPPSTLPFLSEEQIQLLVSSLRDTAVIKLASTLYARLIKLDAPRFANHRLHLPCITFPVTLVRRQRCQDRETCYTYEVKADGLRDMSISTVDKLIQFSRTGSTRQPFLLVRPWNRHDLELPDLADETERVDDRSEPEYPSDEWLSSYFEEDEPVDSESQVRASRLIVRLGQSFGALLLAHQRGGEYKRIASDHSIIARVQDITAVQYMDVRKLEIL